MVVDELRHNYLLKVLLKVSGLKKSTYEYYKSQKHINAYTRKVVEDKIIIDQIKEIFDEHKSRYGYRRVHLELKKNIKINHKKVQRIMRENNLKGIHPKVKYHSYKGDNGLSKKNLLLYSSFDSTKQKEVIKRDFKANRPNEKWTTDVSEFHIPAGKLYLSPILDMFDSSIISYNISTSPNFNQVTDMLNTAFDKNKNLNGLIFHSDQGWQYQMKYYQQRLTDKGIKQSFSRKGNCMDNSLMENFFGIMKNEMFYGQEYKYKTLDILKESMIEYIDYYNNKRINIKRKGLTPIEFRNQSLDKCIIN